jgi:hypothetical protein
LRAGWTWFESGAEFSGLVEYEPVDRGFLRFAMKFELEAVFEEREEELLELLRVGDFGVIDGGAVDVECLVVDPARRARDPVILIAESET